LNSRSARVTPGEAMRVGATPKAEALHLRRVHRRWKPYPAGCDSKAEERACRWASHWLRSSDRARDGMEPGRLASERRKLSASWRCHRSANQIPTPRQTLGQRIASRSTQCCCLQVRCGDAQERRTRARFVCHSVPKKVVHSRASNSRFAPQLTPLPLTKPGRFPRFRRTGPHGCSPSR
jgi:hypothetical protein